MKAVAAEEVGCRRGAFAGELEFEDFERVVACATRRRPWASRMVPGAVCGSRGLRVTEVTHSVESLALFFPNGKGALTLPSPRGRWFTADGTILGIKVNRQLFFSDSFRGRDRCFPFRGVLRFLQPIFCQCS